MELKIIFHEISLNSLHYKHNITLTGCIWRLALNAYLYREWQLADRGPDLNRGRQSSGPRQHFVLDDVIYCNTFINIDRFLFSYC